MTIFRYGGKSQIFLLPYALDLIDLFQFEGKTDVWISQVKCVNETCDLSRNLKIQHLPEIFQELGVGSQNE